ncbi:MAG: hypothetical protein WBA39_09860 [Rivularia sp. (in: cyanobacteria)]
MIRTLYSQSFIYESIFTKHNYKTGFEVKFPNGFAASLNWTAAFIYSSTKILFESGDRPLLA